MLTIDNPQDMDLSDLGDGSTAISDSMILVSDDDDDDYPSSGAGTDDVFNDRTHKVQLGGKLWVPSITIQNTEHEIDFKLPVPVRKVLSVDFIRMNVAGVHSIANIEQAVKTTDERYAQVGLQVNATIKELSWPTIPNQQAGTLDLFDEPPNSLVGPLSANYKQFIDETDSQGTNIFFLLSAYSSRGIAITPRQLLQETEELDGKYLDKAFVHAVATPLGYTPAHELLHLLAYRPDKSDDHSEPFWNLLNVTNTNQSPSVLWSKRIDQVHQGLIDQHPSVSDPQ